ncbi:MAG: 30S ribosomal protein S2, partial [Humibacter sp.]
PGNDDAIRSVGLLTRIVADAAAEGLIQRHQKPEEGEEGAEPLAEWERDLLETGDGSVQSSAETAKVADADLAEGKAEAAAVVDEEAEQIEATESEADAEGASSEAAEVVAADAIAEGDAAEAK